MFGRIAIMLHTHSEPALRINNQGSRCGVCGVGLGAAMWVLWVLNRVVVCYPGTLFSTYVDRYIGMCALQDVPGFVYFRDRSTT